jgi:hypothetical protein
VRLLYRRSGFNALPMIALGFLGIILLGSVLLALPVASATGKGVPWFDTLFTSTSAVCVTGLVVRDTGTAYSTFKDYPIKVAAKTGTAENGILDASANGAFVCYAPLEDPQIAIAVYVEKGGHGSTLASIAKSILDRYFEVGIVGDVNSFENQIS